MKYLISPPLEPFQRKVFFGPSKGREYTISFGRVIFTSWTLIKKLFKDVIKKDVIKKLFKDVQDSKLFEE